MFELMSKGRCMVRMKGPQPCARICFEWCAIYLPSSRFAAGPGGVVGEDVLNV
jgi:hypothetical protein